MAADDPLPNPACDLDPEPAPKPAPELVCELGEDLSRELAVRQRADLPARLWLRDDDVREPTPQLDLFVRLLDRHRVPALLAAIPDGLKTELRSVLDEHDVVSACVHGWAHTNHAPADQRKCEFGSTRVRDDVMAELERGLAIVRQTLPRQAMNIFVPPWNRIAPTWLDAIAEAGFQGVSTLGDQFVGTAPSGLAVCNVHVDIMAWRNGPIARPLHAIAADLAKALHASRGHGNTPVGILTHHLVHDAQANARLDHLLTRLNQCSGVQWLTPDQLIATVCRSNQ